MASELTSGMPSVKQSRPSRLVLGVVTLVALAAAGLAGGRSAPGGVELARAATPPRPNIVLIQADDQAADQFSRKVMPNTEQLLVNGGTSFTNYIATTAQCCPSRASLITGQYAHNDGVTSNPVGYAGLQDKDNVLPVWLQQSGYYTMHVGKFINGYEEVTVPPSLPAPGWDQWYVPSEAKNAYYHYTYFVNGETLHHGAQPGDNVTHVLNRDAVRLVQTFAPKTRPFYLQLDERAPHISQTHDPFGHCGRSAQPQPRDEHAFRTAGLPQPPSFNEADMSDKPAYLQTAPKIGPTQRHVVKKHWQCALDALQGVDRGVKQVYKAVERTGELNRTIFIYISDNGQFYGQHRLLSGKVIPYDEALRLPLIVKAPQRYLGARRPLRKIGRPVGNIDLAPTILNFARAQPCPPQGQCRIMDGRSLLPLLSRSGGWPANRGLLTEYDAPDSDVQRYATCQFAGIRTRNSIYIEHSRVVDLNTGQCVNTDERERYDLPSDPFELNNLCFGGLAANCPADAKQLDLEARLQQLRDCAGIAGRDPHVSGRPHCE
ncbi:MAG TPA: sulfatase [Solirubrobacterales bacterium]|nr:sulfatase [Solirubrobacterales bacterium]